MKKFLNLAASGVFILILAGFCLWGLLTPDREMSFSERRKLAQSPALSAGALLSGDYFTELDKYLADQFPLREQFRGLNTAIRLGPMGQSDVNGLYLEGDTLFKSGYPVKEENVGRFADSMNRIYHRLIEGKAERYYACVIPDKEYFSAHLKADSKRIAEIFLEELEGARPVDIFGSLSLESYYRTDTHWSQDRLLPVMEALGREMGFEVRNDYQAESLSPFYGVYWGQLALNLPGEELKYLTNRATRNAVVENIQKPGFTSVYDVEAFESGDGYDVFLSGATPLLTVRSPEAKTERELVIFRDSFGSSLAPLFLEEYAQVTLVDLRYLSPQLLGDYVDFRGKEVLVLYSALMLNSNIVFK